jgi:hypothetical protein
LPAATLKGAFLAADEIQTAIGKLDPAIAIKFYPVKVPSRCDETDDAG